jgi:hypothetical protein
MSGKKNRRVRAPVFFSTAGVHAGLLLPVEIRA